MCKRCENLWCRIAQKGYLKEEPVVFHNLSTPMEGECYSPRCARVVVGSFRDTPYDLKHGITAKNRAGTLLPLLSKIHLQSGSA